MLCAIGLYTTTHSKIYILHVHTSCQMHLFSSFTAGNSAPQHTVACPTIIKQEPVDNTQAEVTGLLNPYSPMVVEECAPEVETEGVSQTLCGSSESKVGVSTDSPVLMSEGSRVLQCGNRVLQYVLA